MVQGINRSGRPIEVALAGAQLFLPFSLDNPYYSGDRITAILIRCVQQASVAVWVPCDHSKYLNYCGQDNQRTDLAQGDMYALYGKKVSQKFNDAKRMIERCCEDFPDLVCDVRSADALTEDPRYLVLVKSIEDLMQRDQSAAACLDRAVMDKTKLIYGEQKVSENTLHWQKRYVIEEAAMALMYTEVFGHHLELYRSYMKDDLINHLPEDWLKETLGVTELSRVFVPLEPIVGKGRPHGVRRNSGRTVGSGLSNTGKKGALIPMTFDGVRPYSSYSYE